MESTALSRHLLGIHDPWTVERVDLDMTRGHVDVLVGHAKGVRVPCPECGQELAVYDHSAERTWRHLASCQFMTYLHASPPRVACPEHGVRQAHLPWAEVSSRFTRLFEALALNVLLAATVERAAELLRISWDQAWHLMERAVGRGRAAKGPALPKQIGVDEKAIAKGHPYMTVVCDLEEATVEYIGAERKEESLPAYFPALGTERCAGIEAISLDMWPAFINACRANMPGAANKMVFDRFHIMQHVGRGVERVRKQAHKALTAQGDATLARSKYLWRYTAGTMPEAARERFAQIKRENLKTARAGALKESWRERWSYHSRGWAKRFWQRWYHWATHCRLPAMIEAAKLLARHLPNVLPSLKHRSTHAVAEGWNSKIATIQQRAGGFRNRDHFKIAVYCHCGGLNVYPVHVTHGKV